MIQVKDGKVVQAKLPHTGTLSDGRTVSGYHLLDLETLAAEGWLPVEDNVPEYNVRTQRVVHDGYQILEDKVVVEYRVEDLENQIHTMQAVETFVTMMFEEKVPELNAAEVLKCEPLVKEWTQGEYKVGDVRRQGGQVWRCVQGHDSNIDTGIIPGYAAAQWSPYHSDNPEYAKPYIQPEGAHDSYMKGEYCIYKGEIYKCIMDNTVWTPEDYEQAWELYD